MDDPADRTHSENQVVDPAPEEVYELLRRSRRATDDCLLRTLDAGLAEHSPLVVALACQAAEERHLDLASDWGQSQEYVDAAPIYIESLRTGLRPMRSSAAAMLGRLGTDKAAQALVMALDDSRADVRQAAARAIGTLPPARSKAVVARLKVTLAEALEAWRSKAQDHANATNLMAFSPLPGATNTVLRLSSDDLLQAERRCDVLADAMAEIGNAAAFKALVTMHKQGWKRLRPQILKFGEKGEKVLRPRSRLERILGLRRWADRE